MIGVVVPAYNREGNLVLLLASLERQSAAGFHVVIADDGSTDGTAALIARLAGQPAWRGRLTRVSCGSHLGVRTGRARNIGAPTSLAGARVLLMLDTDLVLQPDAIALLASAHAGHPDKVLYGAVEWLPPLEHDEVLAIVGSGRVEELRRRVPATRPARVEGTFTGPELREDLFSLPPGRPVLLRPQWALPLNSAWPLDLYWAAGGFDETMTGYGYQDMEFGERAAAVARSASRARRRGRCTSGIPSPPRRWKRTSATWTFTCAGMAGTACPRWTWTGPCGSITTPSAAALSSGPRKDSGRSAATSSTRSRSRTSPGFGASATACTRG